jgi:methylphosphotriester-DNA--protein-cysteine methyltransferase
MRASGANLPRIRLLAAVSHWCYGEMFRRHCPAVRLREDLVLCLSGEDPASFRRLFKRKTGLTPAACRRKFAGLAAPRGLMARR